MLRETERGRGRGVEREEWKEGEKKREEEVGKEAVGRREKGRLSSLLPFHSGSHGVAWTNNTQRNIAWSQPILVQILAHHLLAL